MEKNPIGMYFVVVMVFLERFTFSSLRSVLSFYMRDVLLYNESEAVHIYHLFLMLCYISAILGGIVGNSDYGKYKTISTFSIVYWIGLILLFWSTAHIRNTVSINFMTLYSLVLISIGVGGIKCCIAAFGVDQIIGSDQNVTSKQVRVFFSTFYFSIHLGMFFGMITSPIINKLLSYDGYNFDKYAVRFGMVVITMAISIGVFFCGNQLYFFRKSANNVLPEMMKCIFFSLWKRLTWCKKMENKHWLEFAKHSYSNDIINDTKKTLHILCLYIPLSMFWSLFDQQGTTWIFQASRTSDRLFGLPFTVYMLQVVNPMLVLFTIPFMDRIVYPYLKSIKLFKHPLKRMLLGGSIAGIAFIFAGCLEICLETNNQDENIPSLNSYYDAYAKPRSANLWTSNLGLQKFNETGYFILDRITTTDCLDEKSIQIRLPKSVNQKLKYDKKSIVLLVMGNSLLNDNDCLFNSSSVVLVPENIYTTSEITHSSIIHVIFRSNDDDRTWLHIKNLTLESKSMSKTTIFDEALPVAQFQNINMLTIPSGLYTLTIHYTDKNRQPVSRNVLNLETNSIFMYRNVYDNVMISKIQSNAVLHNSVLSKGWLLPQFIFMTFGETLFTMTGLSFSFSETPESMKTVSISMWYFCVALGNLTVIVINKFVAFDKKSNMFFMFAFIALVTIIVTCKLSNAYEKLYYVKKSNTEKSDDGDENVDLVMLLKKESFQLSF